MNDKLLVKICACQSCCDRCLFDDECNEYFRKYYQHPFQDDEYDMFYQQSLNNL